MATEYATTSEAESTTAGTAATTVTVGWAEEDGAAKAIATEGRLMAEGGTTDDTPPRQPRYQLTLFEWQPQRRQLPVSTSPHQPAR
jgi:hypothetical protein